MRGCAARSPWAVTGVVGDGTRGMEILSLGPPYLPPALARPAGTGHPSEDTARLVCSLGSWPHSCRCVPASSMNGHLPAAV